MNSRFNSFLLVLSYTATANCDFHIVSSTISPSDDQSCKNHTTNRLEALEAQNAKILNTLDSLNHKILKLQGALSTGDNSKATDYPTNCQEVKNRGNYNNGIYIIKPRMSKNPFAVFCDMDTNGGGWTHFFNRFDGSQEFYNKWEEYKRGFGSLTGEFWLGLDYLHEITTSEVNEMLVEVTDWDEKTAYALYDVFVVGSEGEGYILKALQWCNGTAGDSMSYYSGMKFTTPDKDQDLRTPGNCAVDSHGAWWYNACTTSNPTATYLKAARVVSYSYNIMYWKTFRGVGYSLKKMKMMVRPKGQL